MKILVFGANGMLGHKLLQRLTLVHDAWGTVRGSAGTTAAIQGFSRERLIWGVNALDLTSVRDAMDRVGAEVVVNCIGIVKQIGAAKDPITSISINALLPHQIAALCAERGARLIHFSTDCVFSGQAGPYRESDLPDPADLYGRTKLLGEVDRPGCLTLRTSIVGREIHRGTGLLEWFIAQRGGQVRGFRQALYSGLTTGAMTDLLRFLIEEHADLTGVWQVSGDPIDKYSLLCLVNNVYGLGISIDPEYEFRCDRRLDSSRFREATGWSPPSWQSMIETMHADPLL